MTAKDASSMEEDSQQTSEHRKEEPGQQFINDAVVPQGEESQQRPKTAQRGMQTMFMELSRSGALPSLHHPLFEKFTTDHITKFLDYSHQDDTKRYEQVRSSSRYRFAYFLTVVLALIFVLVFFTFFNQPVLPDVLKVLVSFAGGFGAGYGLKTVSHKRSN